MQLKEHKVILKGDKVVLRPMTEYDWDLIWKWNYNPTTLFFSSERSVSHSSPEQIQHLYREVSKDAFCFIIEVDSKPVGDCWFESTPPTRILRDYPVRHCRCIDLMIGEEDFFNPSFSIDTVRTLTKFGFEEQEADIIFICDILNDRRLLKIFQKAGYQVYQKVEKPFGKKMHFTYDFILTAEQYGPL